MVHCSAGMLSEARPVHLFSSIVHQHASGLARRTTNIARATLLYNRATAQNDNAYTMATVIPEAGAHT